MIVLGLGSNVGDRKGFLRAAIQLLADKVRVVRCSSLYESAAMLPDDAPVDWNLPFLNMAVVIETTLPPEDLLVLVKAVEQKIGRQTRGHWGPREIDVDILAFHHTVIESLPLKLPHPGLLLRDFALVPLAEIAPDWKYPVAGVHFGKTAVELVTLIPNHLTQAGALL